VSRVTIDRVSLLVDTAADVTLDELEATLSRAGCTLHLDGTGGAAGGTKVGAWLGAGARGARTPYADPADHLLAGFTATNVANGEALVVRAAPRKSVGPDLAALVVGMHERFFVLTRATLRVFLRAEPMVTVPFVAPADPPPSEAEEALLARLGEELART